MKKGQSGVSLIALVITIIVVIILAAVAFGTSTRTITNANWSTFANAVGEVRTALQTRVTTVKGEEAAKGSTRTDAQVYNFVAKGGDITRKDGSENSGSNSVVANVSNGNNASWLSREGASTLQATRIEPTVIKSVLGLSNLNTIKVNTPLASGREVSYFVTNKGDVFVWPPYEYEGKLWINETTSLPGTDVDAALTTKTPFTINGVSVSVANAASYSGTVSTALAAADLSSIASVYYADSSSAKMPQGIETNALYNDGSNG